MSQSKAIPKNTSCQCGSELALLRDTVASLQVDILGLKQWFHGADKLRNEQMRTATTTLKSDLLECGKTIHSCVNVTHLKLDDVRNKIMVSCSDNVKRLECRVPSL